MVGGLSWGKTREFLALPGGRRQGVQSLSPTERRETPFWHANHFRFSGRLLGASAGFCFVWTYAHTAWDRVASKRELMRKMVLLNFRELDLPLLKECSTTSESSKCTNFTYVRLWRSKRHFKLVRTALISRQLMCSRAPVHFQLATAFHFHSFAGTLGRNRWYRTRRLQTDVLPFDADQCQHLAHQMRGFAYIKFALGFTHGRALQEGLKILITTGRRSCDDLP